MWGTTQGLLSVCNISNELNAHLLRWIEGHVVFSLTLLEEYVLFTASSSVFLIVLYTVRIIRLSSFHNDQDFDDNTHTLLIFEINGDWIVPNGGFFWKCYIQELFCDNDGLSAVLPEVLELRKGEMCFQWANMSFFLWPLLVQNILPWAR